MAERNLVAQITVSRKPDADTEKKIMEFIKSRGCSDAEYVIDTNILGGIVIQIGNEIYDGSLRSRLEKIRRAL